MLPAGLRTRVSRRSKEQIGGSVREKADNECGGFGNGRA